MEPECPKRLDVRFTDKDPQKNWLHKIKATEDYMCSCQEQRQNAAHILQCKEVGDGKGRTLEQAAEDEEWCGAAYEMLKKE